MVLGPSRGCPRILLHRDLTHEATATSGPFLRSPQLDRRQDGLARSLFGGRDRAQDPVERADSQRLVIRDGEAVMRGRFGLQDDVTAYLVYLSVSPLPAQNCHQLAAVKVARQFHAITSSRTRRRRTRVGAG